MLLTIIADDLTGANDSAAQFARLGLSILTALPGARIPRERTDDVLVFDSESRDLPQGRAYAAVRAAAAQAKAFSPRIWFKKVDSAMRGNIGAEIRAVADVLSPSLVVVAPAFISAGRTTEGGAQLAGGRRLEETEFARDPKSPVATSDIAAIVAAQADFPVMHLSLSDLERGEGSVGALFADLSARRPGTLVVCDAAEERHLGVVAGALKPCRNVLYVGSAGLALAVSETMRPVPASGAPLPAAEKVLVLAGSVSPVTRAQVRLLGERLSGAAAVGVDPRLAVENPGAAAEACAREAERLCADRDVVVVCAALREGDVDACREAAGRAGLSFGDAGERMARVMSGIMKLLAGRFQGFAMTGGDTAAHACMAAGIGLLSPRGEVAPGMPVSEIVSGPHAGKLLVTKAGAFGREDAFVRAAGFLRGTADLEDSHS